MNKRYNGHGNFNDSCAVPLLYFLLHPRMQLLPGKGMGEQSYESFSFYRSNKESG